MNKVSSIPPISSETILESSFMSASLEATMHEIKNIINKEVMKKNRCKRSSIKASATINKIKARVDPQVPGATLINPEPKPIAIKWKMFFVSGKLFFSMVPALLSWK